MPTIPKRPTAHVTDEVPAAIAALIAHVETSAGALPGERISHRDFREFVRDRALAQDEAWTPIRRTRLRRGL